MRASIRCSPSRPNEKSSSSRLGFAVRPGAPVLPPQPGPDLRGAHRLIDVAETDHTDGAVARRVGDHVDVLAVLDPMLAALREEVARVVRTRRRRERQEPRDVGVRRVLEQRRRVVLARLAEHTRRPIRTGNGSCMTQLDNRQGAFRKTRCMQMSLGEADRRVKASRRAGSPPYMTKGRIHAPLDTRLDFRAARAATSAAVSAAASTPASAACAPDRRRSSAPRWRPRAP